jgi:hypothetical protein
MVKNHTKTLFSKQEILDYLRISDYLFRKFVEKGMPARYENSRWTAHCDNLEDFFRKFSNVSMRKSIKNIDNEN